MAIRVDVYERNELNELLCSVLGTVSDVIVCTAAKLRIPLSL